MPPHVRRLRLRPLLPLLSLVSLLLLLLFAAVPGGAARAPQDLAARGLDAFVHAPTQAAPGATFPLQAEAFGFPSAIAIVPLPGAEIEAAWDPEHLGPGVSVAPPSVRVTTDASGRARLEVPVPDGGEQALSLLVGVRWGDHKRTRAIPVQRVRPDEVAIQVADPRVVPGSTIGARVLVTRAGTTEPVVSEPVSVSLEEGGVARFTATAATDAAGIAAVHVPIPRTGEPAWTWTLVARATRGGYETGSASITLAPREETPSTPSLIATWTTSPVRAGEKGRWVARVRDGSDTPVAGASVRAWVGPRGTTAPDEDDAWEKASRPLVTTVTGEVSGEADTPTTVAGPSTTMTLEVRAKVDGIDLRHSATLDVDAPRDGVTLSAEAGSIIPGVSQRLLLKVRGRKDEPVAGPFLVLADGLRASVVTDASGEAEVVWHPPLDVGALRNVGPCPGGVAATVVVRTERVAAGEHAEPFELCLPVDREAVGFVRLGAPVVRAGEHASLEVVTAAPPRPGDMWSVVLRSESGVAATSAWIPAGTPGEIRVPEGASGTWTISAALTSGGGRRAKGRVAKGALLVVPRTLPKLTAKVVGGKATPGGTVDVEARLVDQAGHGLAGAVSTVTIDLHGGGSLRGIEHLDTRARLCARAIEDARCDRFLEGDPALDPVRRATLGEVEAAPLLPEFDPPATMDEEIKTSFHDVVTSLEGAVFESTEAPERLRDVRRKGPGGWTFNPELMTLVTAAMGTPPVTPGGERFGLADLVAVDPQVSFDRVARRVARLKLFQVLAALRAYKQQQHLSDEEPLLKDPNALLRRLLKDSPTLRSKIVDPWGGSLTFVPSATPAHPFLAIARGFELRSPGPDGVAGNGDDVRDPFERVLRSGSPYAVATEEDSVVDARSAMVLGDATVEAWEELLHRVTGTTLGQGGEGTGQGFGSGHGRLGGSHQTRSPQIRMGSTRVSPSVVTDVERWTAPVRTDADGRVLLHVALGDAETTWHVALLAVPDHASPATTTLDVPIALPLSARVEVGASWIEGDDLDVRVTVRNRTAQPVHATLSLAAGGVAMLADAREHTRAVDVPAGGVVSVPAHVRASRAGAASLDVTTSAADLPDDTVHETWDVLPAGEAVDLTHVALISGEVDLSPWLGHAPYEPLGTTRLVLERGSDAALAAALDALDPDGLRSASAAADAVDVAARVRTHALARGGASDPLAVLAGEILHAGTAKLAAYHAASPSRWPVLARAHASVPAMDAFAQVHECPPQGEMTERPDELAEGIDAEPPPVGAAVAACWDAYVSSALEGIEKRDDAPALARAILAFADRPHRAVLIPPAVSRLRKLVSRSPAGFIVAGPSVAHDRASRALVYAGLLRAAEIEARSSDGAGAGTAGRAPSEVPELLASLLVQRDAHAGFGSPSATRAAVRALLALTPGRAATASKVAVVVDGVRQDVDVYPGRVARVRLGPEVKELRVESGVDGIVARLVRPSLRAWRLPPPAAEPSPVHLDVTWPADAEAGRKATLVVSLRHDLAFSSTIDATIPLPPGATLAQAASGVRQVQGALVIRRDVSAGSVGEVLQVPLRFALRGRMTAPEALAELAHDEAPRARATARPLTVR